MTYLRYALLLIVVAALTVLVYRTSNRSWINFHQAEALRAQNNYAAATPIYQQLWNSGFTKRQVFERLTECLYAVGNFIDAIPVCQTALAASVPETPTSPPVTADAIPDWKARWELARALSYTRRYDESIREYNTLLQERPALNEARMELSETLYSAGQPDKGLHELLQVPDAALTEKARLLMADLHAALKEYAAAADIYRRHLAAYPNDDDARVKFADILSWHEQYGDSLSQFEMLLKRKPDDIQLRRKYANVLMWAGRHDEAVVEFKKTLK
ncbi:MAG: tetratricopeptide repeat protein [Kiritimatiellota bacterium]|nr:tetratricopeptide repeat protein [Kiritimatiellota bacterium]